MNSNIAQLFRSGQLWQGDQILDEDQPIVSTGHITLDQCLLGGWSIGAVHECYVSRFGFHEIALLMPTMRQLQTQSDRLQLWFNPPFIPNPHALCQQLDLSRLLVIDENHQNMIVSQVEQTARSGGCDLIIAWLDPINLSQTRRIQLAANQGDCLVFLCFDRRIEQQGHPVATQLRLFNQHQKNYLEVLKRRGGWPLEPQTIEYHHTSYQSQLSGYQSALIDHVFSHH